MPIEFGCQCGKTLRVRDDLAGDRVKCPVCGEIRQVPHESLPAVPSTQPSPKQSLSADQVSRTRRHHDVEEGINEALENPSSDTFNRVASSVGPAIVGKPVDTIFRVLVPSPLGHSLLKVDRLNQKLIEETHRLGSFRRSEFRLDEVTGAEIRLARNRGLLYVGLMTLPMVIGLLPLIAFVFVRYRLLEVFLTSSNTLVISIHSLEAEGYEFIDELLTRPTPEESAEPASD